MEDNARTQRKTFQGTVVSDKVSKTRVVEVGRAAHHTLYEKVLRKTSKFYAHDEGNESKSGDLVEIASTRPLSKLKRWRIVRVISKANA